MKVSLEKAMEISKNMTTFPDLLQLSETDDLWLFSYGEKGVEIIPGEPIIAVSKSTGKAEYICLPSDEGFAILSKAVSFPAEQIEFMKSLGLEFDFENLTDDDLVQLEDAVGEKLQKSGFDENNDVTAVGRICESILDRLS